jgi:hypothetical protein
MVTVTAQLADLLRDGVRLDYTDPERPDFVVLPAHRARVRALLGPDVRPATQRALRAIAAYRAALLRIFDAIARDADPGADLDHQARLCDDLGPRLASLIGDDAATAYTEQTGRCAYCGGPEHAEKGDR